MVSALREDPGPAVHLPPLLSLSEVWRGMRGAISSIFQPSVTESEPMVRSLPQALRLSDPLSGNA